MQPHIYQFNNKNIHYQEYGAGAYIKHNNHIIADFKSHLDAEAFLKLLPTTHPQTTNQELTYTAESDDHPNQTAQIQIHTDQEGTHTLTLHTKHTTQELITTDRDQWGVYITIGNTTIAQEDGTRSILNALIQALQHLQTQTEHQTTPATITHPNPHQPSQPPT